MFAKQTPLYRVFFSESFLQCATALAFFWPSLFGVDFFFWGEAAWKEGGGKGGT